MTAIERRRAGLSLLHSAPAGAAVAFSRLARVRRASRGRVDVVTLVDRTVRTVRHAGAFAQLAVDAGRVRRAPARTGAAAVLDLRIAPAAHRASSRRARLALAPTACSTPPAARSCDARLQAGSPGQRPWRDASSRSSDGAAYLADGDRPAPARLPARVARDDFARLPGKVVALTRAAQRRRCLALL